MPCHAPFGTRYLCVNQKPKWIIGIDEAGRGPLAGPVAIGAALYDASDTALQRSLEELFPVVKDSKQLSETRREALYGALLALSRTTTLRLRVVLVPASTIDAHGITRAINTGIDRVTREFEPHESRVLLDGGLRAPDMFVHQETHIRGDATYLPIALASIVAKVRRDRHMRLLARRHPAYGFEIHKGYGTPQHYAALARHGASTIHRRTFLGARRIAASGLSW